MKRIETTFKTDFAIADRFGESAIRDTYNRSHESFKDDVQYYTELVVALNLALWKWYYRGNEKIARLYDLLWKKADEYAMNHFKGEELDFYLSETD